jgi:phage FluMu protein Com
MAEASEEQEVRCRNCGKLLGKITGGRLEMVNGKGATRVYSGVVVIDCPRCGHSVDMVLDKSPRH